MVPMPVEACEKVSVVGAAPAKIAVLLGTVCGDQLVLVFQSAPGPAQVDWARAGSRPRHDAARAHATAAANRKRTPFMIWRPLPCAGFLVTNYHSPKMASQSGQAFVRQCF